MMIETLNKTHEEYWEEIFDEYNCIDLSEVQHGRKSINFMDWLKENYNPPTQKKII